MNRSYLILIGVIVVLAVGLIGLLLFINSQPDANRGITPLVQITLWSRIRRNGRQLPQPVHNLVKDRDE